MDTPEKGTGQESSSTPPEGTPPTSSGEKTNGQDNAGRASLVAKASTPMGVLCLCLIIIEGALVAAATRAKEVNLTVLLVGIIVVMLLIIVVAAFALTDPGNRERARSPLTFVMGTVLIIAFGGGSVWGGWAFFRLSQKHDELGEKFTVLSVSRALYSNELSAAKSRVEQLNEQMADFKSTAADVIRLSYQAKGFQDDLAALTKEKAELVKDLSEQKSITRDAVRSSGLALDKQDEIAHEAERYKGLVSTLTAENTQLRDQMSSNISKKDFEAATELIQTLNSNYAKINADFEGISGKNKLLEEQLEPFKEIGLVKFYRGSHDFIPEIKSYIEQSTNLIILSGINFYITLREHEESILDALARGVDIKILAVDQNTTNFSYIVADFGQTDEELRGECERSMQSTKKILEKWRRLPAEGHRKGRFEVRLTKLVPRSRCYFFDPELPDEVAYAVMYMNNVDSRKLPGFLLKSTPNGLSRYLLESFKLSWDLASIWPLPPAQLAALNTPAQPGPANIAGTNSVPTEVTKSSTNESGTVAK